MSGRLAGKVVVVTGAAQGIGFACARMTAAENAGATADGVFDEIDHALDMMRTNHRADIGVGVVAGAKAQFFCLRDAASGELIANRLLDEKTLDRKANLAAVRVAAPDGGACGYIKIGIGQDQHSVFAAEFEHSRNQPLGASFSDAASRGNASGEQDFVRISLNERLAHFPSPLHDGD